MNSRYKIFLTRSAEVSRTLCDAFTIGKNNVVQIGCGPADYSDFIPTIYDDYFYCLVKFDSDRPGYEIIFA